jgi:hypothetical protein
MAREMGESRNSLQFFFDETIEMHKRLLQQKLKMRFSNTRSG